jgi:hypothetical protein
MTGFISAYIPSACARASSSFVIGTGSAPMACGASSGDSVLTDSRSGSGSGLQLHRRINNLGLLWCKITSVL